MKKYLFLVLILASNFSLFSMMTGAKKFLARYKQETSTESKTSVPEKSPATTEKKFNALEYAAKLGLAKAEVVRYLNKHNYDRNNLGNIRTKSDLSGCVRNEVGIVSVFFDAYQGLFLACSTNPDLKSKFDQEIGKLINAFVEQKSQELNLDDK